MSHSRIVPSSEQEAIRVLSEEIETDITAAECPRRSRRTFDDLVIDGAWIIGMYENMQECWAQEHSAGRLCGASDIWYVDILMYEQLNEECVAPCANIDKIIDLI